MGSVIEFSRCLRCGEKYDVLYGHTCRQVGIERCPRCGREAHDTGHVCASSDVEAHRAWTIDARPAADQILAELRTLNARVNEMWGQLEDIRRHTSWSRFR